MDLNFLITAHDNLRIFPWAFFQLLVYVLTLEQNYFHVQEWAELFYLIEYYHILLIKISRNICEAN